MSDWINRCFKGVCVCRQESHEGCAQRRCVLFLSSPARLISATSPALAVGLSCLFTTLIFIHRLEDLRSHDTVISMCFRGISSPLSILYQNVVPKPGAPR